LSGNNVGLVLNVSDNNQIQGNVVTGNADGVRLSNSRNNTMQLNAVSSNSGAGIYVLLSDSNFFLHNALFNNSLSPVSVNSTNRWDDGIEGNYWGSTGLVDADRNGIGDAPFVLGNSDSDNFPLMAEYMQLVAVMDDRQYVVGFVCNSSISDLRYFRDPENSTTLLTFKVGAFEGLGFCRIAIPRALIQPPFDVTVDNVSPLYQRVVGSNGTHSWLCFSFPYVAGEVRIVNAAPSPPFWTELWFWGIVALAVVVAVLALAVYMFYRRLGAYRRTVEDVERRLRERERSPLEVARRLFGADVERRSVKIGKFEEKYGIKIRPRESLDDIFRGLEKKDKERGEKDEVNS
jgi:parallel beta-helix repeat protein